MKINDFETDLRYSYESSIEEFWDAVYKKAFPDLVNTEKCTDLHWQRQGVDRVINLSSGHTLHVDEKCRREVYQDILLEYTSNDTTGSPGWIEKTLGIDYLAYAFMPIETVYLFPWQMLRRAWLHYGAEWKKEYKNVPAKNQGYTTWSVVVPIKVLRGAVNSATIIKLGSESNGL